MTDTSPTWKKPSDVMKLRRKKRRLENENSCLTEKRTKLENSFSKDEELSPCGSISSPFYQHKNPFRRNSFTPVRSIPPFISNTQGTTHSKTTSIRLFNALDISELKKVKDNRSDSVRNGHQHYPKSDGVKTKENSPNEDSRNKVCNNSGVAKKEDLQALPVDWSLKQKMRFICNFSSFDWCKDLRTSEEAEGVSSYLANQLPETTPPSFTNLKALPESSWRSRFHRECLYWVHPNLPWVKLFPRIVQEKSLSSINLGDEVYSSLLSDWSESFLSAFSQLRSGYSPYIYVCTHQFTVLFKKEKASKSHSTLLAVLTPTTRGIREALLKEGIQFKMPFNPKHSERLSLESNDSGNGSQKSKNSSISSQNSLNEEQDCRGDDDEHDGEADLFEEEESTSLTCNTEETHCKNLQPNKQVEGEEYEEEEDGFTADEGAAVWLESIGLDKKNFPSLNPNKVRLNREGFKHIDCRPESVIVLDKDVDVQALFNFLLNWRACIAAVGPQHGIPPTILSSNGFKGGVLKSLKVKHSSAYQKDKQKISVMEMVGPILPTHVQGLVKLIREIQEEDFTLSLHTHEPTTALNVQTDILPSSLGLTFKHSITDIICTPDGFTWS